MNFKQLRQIAEKASKEGWGPYMANVPFYADVHKPQPSLSKHDDTRPTYWRVEDAVFIAAFNPTVVLQLLDKLEEKDE